MPRVNDEYVPSPIEALCTENRKLLQQRAELLKALQYTQWHLERLGQTESDAYKRNEVAIAKAEVVE